MNCPNCSNPIQPNQLFCAICGAKLQPEMDVEKTVAANPEELSAFESAPAPAASPAPQQEAAPSPWSYPAGNWQPPEQSAPPVSEHPAAPQVQHPVYEQPAVPQYQPPAYEQPQTNNYAQQYQQYQQPSQYTGTQPAYQQGYNMPVAVAEKKSFNPKLLIPIIAAVLVVAGMVVGGIFLFRSCANPAKGSYKDAVNDLVSMLNAGQYEEAMKKYLMDGETYVMTETERQSIALLSGIHYDVQINEANSRVYPRGSSEFNNYLSSFTSDTVKQNQITEIVAADAQTTVTGNVLGQPINETSSSTIYMARINGEWKMPAGSSFSPY